MEKEIINIDNCIIGGSIAGLWTAWELAKKGQKVLVIDKIHIGYEKNNLDVCISHLASPEMTNTILKAQEKWLEIKDKYAEEINIELRGSLSFVLNDTDEERLEKTLNRHKEYNKDTGSFILKDKQAIKSLLKVKEIGEQVKSAFVCVEDLSLNSQLCLDFLRHELIQNGAKFWGSDEVLDFEIDNGNVTGLVTKESIINVKKIIFASGAKSGLLLKRLGLKLPIRPSKAHIVEYTSKVKLPNQLLHYKSNFGDYICKPMLNGRNHLIYTGIDDQMQATWSRSVNNQVVNSSILEMVRILPVLEYADIQAAQTLQLAITPDRMPYLGRTRFYKNIYFNIGLNGLNYMLAPYFAEYMADLVIADKETEEFSKFNPDRFMPEDYELDFSSIEASEHTEEELRQEETPPST